MIPYKAVTKRLCGNSEKSFLKCKKMASRNIFRHFFRANFFVFVLISNHTGFLHVEINFQLSVFKKAEIFALAEAARAISAF